MRDICDNVMKSCPSVSAHYRKGMSGMSCFQMEREGWLLLQGSRPIVGFETTQTASRNMGPLSSDEHSVAKLASNVSNVTMA